MFGRELEHHKHTAEDLVLYPHRFGYYDRKFYNLMHFDRLKQKYQIQEIVLPVRFHLYLDRIMQMREQFQHKQEYNKFQITQEHNKSLAPYREYGHK